MALQVPDLGGFVLVPMRRSLRDHPSGMVGQLSGATLQSFLFTGRSQSGQWGTRSQERSNKQAGIGRVTLVVFARSCAEAAIASEKTAPGVGCPSAAALDSKRMHTGTWTLASVCLIQIYEMCM